MREAEGTAANDWWTDEDFWSEMFEFIFPPEQLALGERVAERTAALLRLAPGARVLDLGCGPGRVAVPLARRGYRVVGVDAQPRYLAYAQGWAARAGVALELRRGNLAELEDDAAFDAALSVFTSFGYFADPRRDGEVLARARRALVPGGRLLLETAHRDGVVRLLRAREVRAADGRTWREEPRFDPVTGVLETSWTLEAPDRRRTFTTRLRPYSATELRDLLAAAGFREITLQGDLDGGPVSLDRWTAVAIAVR